MYITRSNDGFEPCVCMESSERYRLTTYTVTSYTAINICRYNMQLGSTFMRHVYSRVQVIQERMIHANGTPVENAQLCCLLCPEHHLISSFQSTEVTNKLAYLKQQNRKYAFCQKTKYHPKWFSQSQQSHTDSTAFAASIIILDFRDEGRRFIHSPVQPTNISQTYLWFCHKPQLNPAGQR